MAGKRRAEEEAAVLREALGTTRKRVRFDEQVKVIEMPEEGTEEEDEEEVEEEEKSAAVEVGEFIMAQRKAAEEEGRGEGKAVTLQERRSKVLRQQKVEKKAARKEKTRKRKKDNKELKNLQEKVLKLMEKNKISNVSSLKRRVKKGINKEEDGNSSTSSTEDSEARSGELDTKPNVNVNVTTPVGKAEVGEIKEEREVKVKKEREEKEVATNWSSDEDVASEDNSTDDETKEKEEGEEMQDEEDEVAWRIGCFQRRLAELEPAAARALVQELEPRDERELEPAAARALIQDLEARDEKELEESDHGGKEDISSDTATLEEDDGMQKEDVLKEKVKEEEVAEKVLARVKGEVEKERKAEEEAAEKLLQEVAAGEEEQDTEFVEEEMEKLKCKVKKERKDEEEEAEKLLQVVAAGEDDPEKKMAKYIEHFEDKMKTSPMEKEQMPNAEKEIKQKIFRENKQDDMKEVQLKAQAELEKGLVKSLKDDLKKEKEVKRESEAVKKEPFLERMKNLEKKVKIMEERRELGRQDNVIQREETSLRGRGGSKDAKDHTETKVTCQAPAEQGRLGVGHRSQAGEEELLSEELNKVEERLGPEVEERLGQEVEERLGQEVEERVEQEVENRMKEEAREITTEENHNNDDHKTKENHKAKENQEPTENEGRKDSTTKLNQTNQENKGGNGARGSDAGEATKDIPKESPEAATKEAAAKEEEEEWPAATSLVHRDLRLPGSNYEPVTLRMHQQVVAALTNPSFKKRSREGFDITRRDLCSLTGDRWLNDQVVQFYLALVVERSISPAYREEGRPRVLAMSTFILQNLLKESRGHAWVARWTSSRRASKASVDVFHYHLIFFPLHLVGEHWALAAADLRTCTLTSYDSMGGQHPQALDAVMKYLQQEHMVTRECKLRGFWRLEEGRCPRQGEGNTTDCGVFLCRMAERLGRGVEQEQGGPEEFTQADMPFLRRRCLYEVVRGKLL